MNKILVFTEGTVLMHKAAFGMSREERVKQSMNGESSVADFASYIPNGRAADKLNTWKQQGVDIHYLTSRTKEAEIEAIRSVLTKYNFPDAHHLHARVGSQSYADVAEEVLPDILIEDDCESIGGEAEMTYPYVRHDIKPRIKSIVVREFEGIDHLPTALTGYLDRSF
jgi:hypothetical protein